MSSLLLAIQFSKPKLACNKELPQHPRFPPRSAAGSAASGKQAEDSTRFRFCVNSFFGFSVFFPACARHIDLFTVDSTTHLDTSAPGKKATGGPRFVASFVVDARIFV